MSGVRVFRRFDGNRIDHDTGRHIVGPILRDSASPKRGRQNHQTKSPGMDWTHMDVRLLVFGCASARHGIQPVRARGVSDQLQLRLPDGRQPRKGVHTGVLRGRVVHTVHHDILLLREDPDGGVDDQRHDRQPIRPGRGKAQDRDPTWVRGDRRHRAVVRVVDAVRHRGLARGVRPEGVYHTARIHDSGAVLQGGQLHGPVDLRHHASQVQE